MKDTWDTRLAKLRLSADSFVRQQEAHAKVREGSRRPAGLWLVGAARGKASWSVSFPGCWELKSGFKGWLWLPVPDGNGALVARALLLSGAGGLAGPSGCHCGLQSCFGRSLSSTVLPLPTPYWCFLFQLDNLTLMEINTTGTFLTQALDHMYKLRTNLQPGESSRSQDF